MEQATLIPIVEGYGEVNAVPILLRRILYDKNIYNINIDNPINAHNRPNILKQNGLERFIEVALRRKYCDALLVLLDADDDCAKELGFLLANRLQAICAHVPAAVVVAKRCYESWFLGSTETLAGKRGLANPLQAVSDPETVPNPKRWLTEHMPGSRAYKETSDQAALTQLLDCRLVRNRSRSFRRLEHALDQLVTCLQKNTVMITPGIPGAHPYKV